LGLIPAQKSRVRYIKRNKAFNTYFSAFPSITCKTSNKKCMKYNMKLTLLGTYQYDNKFSLAK
jgi:hypothetical protein